MRKNPFSIYDFLGYVFPGALALFLIYLQVETPDAVRLSDFYRAIAAMDFPFSLEETIMLTITAYITGHLIAYLSSVTVERFSVWVYDYPSKYLLEKMPRRHFWRPYIDYQNYLVRQLLEIARSNGLTFRRFIRFMGSPRHQARFLQMYADMAWRVFFSLCLLPIALGTLTVSWLLGLKSFLTKPLDNDLRNAVRTHSNALQNYLQIRMGRDSDSHRIIYHYEYERMGAHALKMDNYVALYGFLRATAFIFNVLFMWLLITTAIPTIDCSAAMDWHLVLLLLSVGMLAYIFFLAFMKFYRRFTLESFMCLMADTSYYHQSEADIRPLRNRRNSTVNSETTGSEESGIRRESADEAATYMERETAEIAITVNGEG